MDDDDLERYRNHPLVKALAADQHLLTRRRAPPVPRDGKGRVMKGFTANPHGRPPGRVSLRAAFHRYGLNGLAKLNTLADDARLTPGERAVIYAEQVRLAYSLKAIRSDASAQRKLVQQQREAEMDEAVRHFFERANIPPPMLARMQAAASSGALFGAKARAPSGAAAPSTPGEVPTGSEARAPSSAATSGGEPAPPSGAKAQPEGETQAPPDGDGNARPGEVPQRPFWIATPV